MHLRGVAACRGEVASAQMLPPGASQFSRAACAVAAAENRSAGGAADGCAAVATDRPAIGTRLLQRPGQQVPRSSRRIGAWARCAGRIFAKLRQSLVRRHSGMRPLGRRPGIQRLALFWIPGSRRRDASRNDGFEMDVRKDRQNEFRHCMFASETLYLRRSLSYALEHMIQTGTNRKLHARTIR